jgi:cytochrome oxidase Cu insertion factor (SCO1/SenC/PrrC family)
MKEPANKKNVVSFAILVFMFGIPIVAAYVMYITGYIPSGRTNKGTLITPVVELAEVEMIAEHDTKTEPASIKQFKGKWTLLMLVNQPCEQLCRKNIYLIRQVRTALGKDANNARVLLVINSEYYTEDLQQFLKDYPKMPVFIGDPIQFKRFSSPFETVVEDYTPRVFIMDPYTSIMMYYPEELNPKDLLSDLKRLILVNIDNQEK